MHNTNHIHSGLFNQSQRRTNTPPSQLAFVIPGNFPLPQLAHFDILYKDWERLQIGCIHFFMNYLLLFLLLYIWTIIIRVLLIIFAPLMLTFLS